MFCASIDLSWSLRCVDSLTRSLVHSSKEGRNVNIHHQERDERERRAGLAAACIGAASLSVASPIAAKDSEGSST